MGNMFGSKIPKLNKEEAAKILDQVFMDCYMDANSVPVEQLESYSNYRSERFMLQKIVAIIAMIFFLILPFLFINPSYTITELPRGERNLPVYQIHVSTLLPIQSVSAVLKGYSIPVYQEEKRTFTVEPIKNGNLTLRVTLFNKQYFEKTVKVTSVDDEHPVFEGSTTEGNDLYIYVSDADSGVDYYKIYAVTETGEIVYPTDFDETEGYIRFTDATAGMEIFVPDRIGNELKLHTTTR